jgi:FAD/FMN-containing dehydrogenase
MQAQNSLVAELAAIVGSAGLLEGEAVTSRSAGIWGPVRTIATDRLVRPATTAELSRVLALCHARRQPVVTHGGLTGVVDGAWARPGDLVLSLERMAAIEELDTTGRTLTVQAGAPLEKVQAAAAAQGLMFPLDLGARGSATIGGNAATNAGGNRVIRYGMVRQSILGLEAVLADGRVLSSMNRMLKNNAGFDLKQLFIGSEGTLGVITRLVLRLVPAPRSQSTALVSAPDFAAVTGLLSHVDEALGGQLSAFEVMWGDYFDFIAAGRSSPLPAGRPYYVLLESLGGDTQADTSRFEAVLADALDAGLIDDAVLAGSEQQRLSLWAIRDDVASLLALKPMFLFDVSLPIRHMAVYIGELRGALTACWPDSRLFVFGHLGDGNLHLGIQAGPADGAAREAVESLVYRPLADFGGSISAEHGIGLEKKAYLGISRTAGEIALMRQLKASLDPHGILNPGKVFDPAGAD